MTSFNSWRTVNLLKKLSFPRLAGTPGEEKARNIILDELKSYGYKPFLDEYEILSFTIKEARFEVLEPWEEEIPCRGVGFSGSTPPEGIEGRIKYVETGDPKLLPREEGCILLMSARPRLESYKRIMKVKPAGIVVSEGSPYRKPSHLDMMPEWRKYGSAPMVHISFKDAYRMLVNGAEKGRITLIQEERKIKSFNIIAEKKGVKYPDEVIVVCAHYDSVYDVPGSTDNAGGTAFVLELARFFAGKETKRTVRFILFSGEELGLRGSQAYVKKLGKEAEKIKMVVNLDVHGGAIGSNGAVVTGPTQIKPYLEILSKEEGINLQIREDVYSSDGTSFAKKNIPSVSFFRSSGASAGIHSPDDDPSYVGPQAYEALAPIVIRFLSTLINAEEFPFPREIPQNIAKKVKEYFEKRLGIVDEKEEKNK
ncbi:MAG: M20/M25/M40 family metallo-hydrolase [Thermoproteales archaeon]|nr:M20/M25/M40 family metallo-hydrolase [Thermoproteales archaeon]